MTIPLWKFGLPNPFIPKPPVMGPPAPPKTTPPTSSNGGNKSSGGGGGGTQYKEVVRGNTKYIIPVGGNVTTSDGGKLYSDGSYVAPTPKNTGGGGGGTTPSSGNIEIPKNTTTHIPNLVISTQPGGGFGGDYKPIEPTEKAPVGQQPNYTYGTGTIGQLVGGQEGYNKPTGLPKSNVNEKNAEIDRKIAMGYTPEKAIYGYSPQQSLDLSQAPQNVRDLAEKGWIITSETTTQKQLFQNKQNPFQLGLLVPQTRTITTYYARRPTTEQTFEYVYGEGRADVLTASAFSKSFLGLGTIGSGIQQLVTGDKKVGESEKESLMEHALYGQELRARGGDLPGLAASIFTSPAVQETVMWAGIEIGAPIVFSGAGALISKGGSLGTKLASTGSKLTTGLDRIGESLTPTGRAIFETTRSVGSSFKTLIGESKQPLIEAGKAFGKASGTRIGQASVIGTMYIGMEGPGLVETAKKRPERFGSELTESLGLWGAMS